MSRPIGSRNDDYDPVEIHKNVAHTFIDRFVGKYQIVIKVNHSKKYKSNDGLLIKGFLKSGEDTSIGRPAEQYNGWSRNEIAKMTGLSKSTVRKYFTNKSGLYESSRIKIDKFFERIKKNKEKL